MLARLLPLALLATPASAQQSAEEALMARIEAVIVLPEGAYPLADYGRNYAYAAPGKVVALYAIPPVPHPGDEGCEVLRADFTSLPCTAAERAKHREADADYAASQARAGERRWLADAKLLPRVSDGGCNYIDVEYDVASARVLRAECHGIA